MEHSSLALVVVGWETLLLSSLFSLLSDVVSGNCSSESVNRRALNMARSKATVLLCCC